MTALSLSLFLLNASATPLNDNNEAALSQALTSTSLALSDRTRAAAPPSACASTPNPCSSWTATPRPKARAGSSYLRAPTATYTPIGGMTGFLCAKSICSDFGAHAAIIRLSQGETGAPQPIARFYAEPKCAGVQRHRVALPLNELAVCQNAREYNAMCWQSGTAIIAC
ncbi:hypothetical protein B0T17DRAFT_616916 [Bombardia bombarda]|uniref:Uncharacterized protein n=1 Tax=Bombardia bombarda TaxID=252184 RepID=A0AA39X0H2_9PEZI|nr:hypothetical protein B0T17DRAFT_616916 [Bombardia bombarda]